MKTKRLTLLLLLLWSKLAFSQTRPLPREKKLLKTWMCHFALQYYNMQSNQSHKLKNPSAKIALGYRSYETIWNWALSLDLHIGPFDHAKDSPLSVDYNGYGISFWSAFNASYFSTSTIFHYLTPTLGLSFMINKGASHDDLKTQLIKTNNLTTDQTIRDYALKIKNLSLLPGFYTVLKSYEPTRSKKPTTAIHEISLQFNYAISLYSSYKSSYKKQVQTSHSSSYDTITDKSHMSGNYYLLSIAILFS